MDDPHYNRPALTAAEILARRKGYAVMHTKHKVAPQHQQQQQQQSQPEENKENDATKAKEDHKLKLKKWMDEKRKRDLIAFKEKKLQQQQLQQQQQNDAAKMVAKSTIPEPGKPTAPISAPKTPKTNFAASKSWKSGSSGNLASGSGNAAGGVSNSGSGGVPRPRLMKTNSENELSKPKTQTFTPGKKSWPHGSQSHVANKGTGSIGATKSNDAPGAASRHGAAPKHDAANNNPSQPTKPFPTKPPSQRPPAASKPAGFAGHQRRVTFNGSSAGANPGQKFPKTPSRSSLKTQDVPSKESGASSGVGSSTGRKDAGTGGCNGSNNGGGNGNHAGSHIPILSSRMFENLSPSSKFDHWLKMKGKDSTNHVNHLGCVTPNRKREYMRQFDAQTGGVARPKSAYTRRTIAAVPQQHRRLGGNANKPLQQRQQLQPQHELGEEEQEMLNMIRQFDICAEESFRERLCSRLERHLTQFEKDKAEAYRSSACYWLARAHLTWRKEENGKTTPESTAFDHESAWRHVQMGVENVAEPIAILANGARDLVVALTAQRRLSLQKQQQQQQPQQPQQQQASTDELKDVCNVVKKLNLDDAIDDENDAEADSANPEIKGEEEKDAEGEEEKNEKNGTFTKESHEEADVDTSASQSNEDMGVERSSFDAMLRTEVPQEAFETVEHASPEVNEAMVGSVKEEEDAKLEDVAASAKVVPQILNVTTTSWEPNLVDEQQQIESCQPSHDIAQPLQQPSCDPAPTLTDMASLAALASNAFAVLQQSGASIDVISTVMDRNIDVSAEMNANFDVFRAGMDQNIDVRTAIDVNVDFNNEDVVAPINATSIPPPLNYQLEDISDDEDVEVMEEGEAEEEDQSLTDVSIDEEDPIEADLDEKEEEEEEEEEEEGREEGTDGDVTKDDDEDEEIPAVEEEKENREAHPNNAVLIVDDQNCVQLTKTPKQIQPISHLSQPYGSSAVRLLIQQQHQQQQQQQLGMWSPWSNGEKAGASLQQHQREKENAPESNPGVVVATPSRGGAKKNSVVTPVRRSTRLTPRVPALEEKRRVVEDWNCLSPESRSASVLKPNRAILDLSFAQTREEDDDCVNGNTIPDNWEELL